MRPGARLVVGCAVVLSIAIASGCSGADPEVSEPTDDEAAPEPEPEPEPEPAPEPEPEPQVVTTDLEGFEPRSVVFANVKLAVTAAHVTNQDLRSYTEGGEPTVDTGGTFLVLDVTATNLLGNTQVGIGESAFTLAIGADTTIGLDERVSFLSDVTSIIRPNTAVESFLAFPVSDGTDLAGAVLVVGAPPDRVEALPLTGPVPEPDYPISEPLEGSAEGAGPTNGGTIAFTLLGATLSEDVPHEHATSPTGIRADEGELFLVLHVRAVKTAGRGNDLLTDGIRLLLDDAPIAPWDLAIDPQGSDQAPTIEPGATSEFWAAFLVPDDAQDLALQVGDFAEEPGIIPFTLPPPLTSPSG